MPNTDFFIDKSLFNAEQLAQFEALVAIGRVEKSAVDPAGAKKEMEGEEPAAPAKKPAKKAEVEDMPETKKSAAPAEPEVPDFVRAALAKSEEFITKAEKKEMAEVAKKYALLVDSVDDLAEKLYNLKKSDTAMYETCIAMMDKQAEMVEKSGLFGEVGKSAGSYATGSSAAMAEAKAEEIMKADPTCDYDTAIAKAYEDPAIMAACDAEYYR